MYIDNSAPRPVDRPPNDYRGTTYALANNVRADEVRSAGSDVEAVRDTALSALRNDRFGLMLAKITEPGSSGALMTMRRDADTAGTDFRSAASSYAENSE
jgi:hypothetical protein